VRPTDTDLSLDGGCSFWGGESPLLGGWSHNLGGWSYSSLQMVDLKS